MKKNWIVLVINSPTYGNIDTNTFVCSTKDEAWHHFKQISKKYLIETKIKYAKKYNVSECLSFTDYFYLAKRKNEFIDIGYQYSQDTNNIILSIKNDFLNSEESLVEDSLIIHMYQCEYNINKCATLSAKHCCHEEIDNFFESITREKQII